MLMSDSPPQLMFNDLQPLSEMPVHRILDANLDRAREGVRIIEEWCRFGLNHQPMTERLKHLRQTLGQWHTPELRMARNTPGDTGTTLTHPRKKSAAVLQRCYRLTFAAFRRLCGY
jgi:thiamine-phosphate pyrophosphorylase